MATAKATSTAIVERLDYIVSLGVDAIWLTPINESPMDDLGYDITDMCAIGEEFGTMEDFQRLLEIAHCMKLKVIVDQVVEPTLPTNTPGLKKAAPAATILKLTGMCGLSPKPDGSPPNNWLSSFTGTVPGSGNPSGNSTTSSNFLESQPDLNWHNDDVVNAILEREKVLARYRG